MSIKISELDEVDELYDGCCFPIVQNNTTKKVTFETICEQVTDKLISDSLIQVVSASISISPISANSDAYDQTANISSSIPTGYTAIGIVGQNMVGAYYSHVFLSKKYIENNVFYYSVKNTSGNTTGTITLTLKVLCLKSS